MRPARGGQDNAAGDQRRWRAVLARDIRFDGQFVYAVRTTRIYCRPSCPAQRPLRKNVEFYLRPDAAERAGFRACRRCHPRLFDELREKERLDEELKIAAAVQQRLRPVRLPQPAGWELSGFSAPCRAVGGDYYDLIETPKGTLIVALGDVSGKGAGAALLMSSLHAAVRAQASLGATPEQVMRTLNRYLYENSTADKFATLFYAELNPTTGRLTYVNAGHPAPLWARPTGEVCGLNGASLPLGIFSDVDYRQESVTLEPGEALVAYSDGFSECADTAGEEFGARRLALAVGDNLQCSAAELSRQVQAAVARHAGAAPAVDDQALVVLRRVGRERDEWAAEMLPSEERTQAALMGP